MQTPFIPKDVKSDGLQQPRLPSRHFGLTMIKLSEVGKIGAGWRTGLRLAGLICLLPLVLLLVDVGPILAHLTAVSWQAFTLMVGLHVVIILLASWRFAIIARVSGAEIGIVDANRLTFGSTLANMVLPTSLAGDAGRVWLVRRFGLTLKAAVGVGVFDRIVGLASLGAIVLLGALAAPTIIPLWTVGAICLISLGIAVVLFARWKPLERPPGVTRYFLQRRRDIFAGVVSLSLGAHLASIAIAYSFLRDQNVAISVAHLLVLFPAVLLAASIPVSIGGWGTRELAAAGAFTVIGFAAPTAIAMAFMFGVTQVFAAGLGTIYFVLCKTDGVTDND